MAYVSDDSTSFGVKRPETEDWNHDDRESGEDEHTVR